MSFIIDHKDIFIKSDSTVQFKQSFDERLNYDDLLINQEDYSDYRPTRLQFEISSQNPLQQINIRIPYANRLSSLHVKYALIGRYNEKGKEWEHISHEIDKERKEIVFSSSITGVFCVFVNHFFYSSFTQRLADEYPRWTKARSNKKSNAQLFLNFFGIELDQVKEYLEWIQDQKYIKTADIHAYDWIHQYPISDIKPGDIISVSSNNEKEIPVLDTLAEFFYNDQNKGIIIDYEEQKAYSSINYGDITLKIDRDGTLFSSTYSPKNYHIWNTFDEFGLLLGVERLHLESNKDYKERILDVFRYPAGTHDVGLTNGIARELKLISRKDQEGKSIVWENDYKDLLLQNNQGKIIDIRSIKIDDITPEPKSVKVTETGDIRILAMHTGKSHQVSFIYGIEKYQLHKKSDLNLHKMMFKENGHASAKLLDWVEYINTVAPVMWDRFNWDEGFWDTIDEKLTGLGFVPNQWDSDIEVWKSYTFDSEV